MGVKLAFRPPSALSDRLSSGFVLANHIFINVDNTDKETDVSWDIYNMKNQF